MLASGDTYTTQEGVDALSVLNGLLNEWRAMRLTIYAQSRHAYTLTANVGAYAIGEDATFHQARPLWFDAITYVASGGQEIPLHIFLPGEWEWTDKTLTTSIPSAVRIGTDMSWTTLTFYPIPSESVAVAIYCPDPNLVSLASVDTAISVPPGWWNALRYNLALELSEEFGKPISAFLVKRAQDTLALIKRQNVNMDVLEMPVGFPGTGGRMDINTGTFRGRG